MYLLPTSEESNRLWSQIGPRQRYLRAAQAAIDEACRLDDSMGALYLDSENTDMVMEDDAMPYFDEIEDDIVNMRRDINGFHKRAPAPRYTEYARGTDTVRFKGLTFEDKSDCPPKCERVSWDEI